MIAAAGPQAIPKTAPAAIGNIQAGIIIRVPRTLMAQKMTIPWRMLMPWSDSSIASVQSRSGASAATAAASTSSTAPAIHGNRLREAGVTGAAFAAAG